MQSWSGFFTERFPLVYYAVLIAGISLSGTYIGGRVFHFLPFMLSFIGIALVLAFVHFSGERKQLGRNQIAQARLSLPQNLMQKKEIAFIIRAMQIILLGYGLILWLLLNPLAGLTYLIIILYSWLISQQFGMKSWLSGHPLVYGFLSHLIIPLIALFAVAVISPPTIFSFATWSFAMMLFGAFFCCDLCSQLDPHLHPMLGTYIHFYGFRLVFNLCAMTLGLSAMGSINLGLSALLIPFEALVLTGLAVLFFQPSLFRLPQTLASVSLVLHAWALVII